MIHRREPWSCPSLSPRRLALSPWKFWGWWGGECLRVVWDKGRDVTWRFFFSSFAWVARFKNGQTAWIYRQYDTYARRHYHLAHLECIYPRNISGYCILLDFLYLHDVFPLTHVDDVHPRPLNMHPSAGRAQESGSSSPDKAKTRDFGWERVTVRLLEVNIYCVRYVYMIIYTYT